MELAARRYARRVLLIHLALLLVVILVVAAAVKYMYRSAREQARGEAQHTQELLCRQTALGIENYYESVTNVLNLLQPPENDPTTRPLAMGSLHLGATNKPVRLSPEGRQIRLRALESGPLARIASSLSMPIWKNIEEKTSMLFVVDPIDDMAVVRIIGSNDPSIDAADVARQAQGWLRTVERKSISPFMRIGSGGAHLICVPIRGQGGLLMVAVIPVRSLEKSLLEQINRSQSTGATLIDEGDTIVSSSRIGAVGHQSTEFKDPRTRALAVKYANSRAAGTEIFDHAETLGDATFEPAMCTIQPVDVLGTKWMLVVAANLAQIDDLVEPIFRDAMIWAAFVMLAMTGILVSTAIQMIRSRSRLERLQMELINRELSQARQIQLSWLPKHPVAAHAIDLAAVNRPASHVSGDFYNWFELSDGRIAVTIGDVTGHGMAAAFLMATTQLLVRMTMQQVEDPGRCLTEVNRQLCMQIFSGQFVTMLLCVIDPAAQTIEIATAGHPPPIIGNGKSHEPLPVDPQLVLGVDQDVEYPTQRFSLTDGITILLYTDGVIEAQAVSGERLQIEGLAGALKFDTQDAQSLADAVTAIVDQFRAGRELDDDLTLVAIALQPASIPANQLASVVDD
jgi:serine phosphatase RsbU (regulator of sigma subunit)